MDKACHPSHLPYPRIHCVCPEPSSFEARRVMQQGYAKAGTCPLFFSPQPNVWNGVSTLFGPITAAADKHGKYSTVNRQYSGSDPPKKPILNIPKPIPSSSTLYPDTRRPTRSHLSCLAPRGLVVIPAVTRWRLKGKRCAMIARHEDGSRGGCARRG